MHNELTIQDPTDLDRRVERYLKSKPDREIAALLLQEVLPELSALGYAGAIIESAIDRLVRADGGSMSTSDAEFKARRVALEDSDASIELFQFTF